MKVGKRPKIKWDVRPPSPEELADIKQKLSDPSYVRAKRKSARQAKVHRLKLRMRLGKVDPDKPYPIHSCTLKQRIGMYNAQQGRCAVCLRAGIQLVVDHCRRTGIIQGLVCNRCNSRIRFLEQRQPELACSSELLGRPTGDELEDRMRLFLKAAIDRAGYETK